MKRIPASLLGALATVILATSCVTYLNSGQWGNDSIPPPPQDPSAEKTNTTVLFANGSWAHDSILLFGDSNSFIQGGILHSWRRPAGVFSLDGHVALSGWYGDVILQNYGGEDSPYTFFGGSTQIGESLGVRLSSSNLFNVGLRGGVGLRGRTVSGFPFQIARTFDQCHRRVPVGLVGVSRRRSGLYWGYRQGRDASRGSIRWNAFFRSG